MPDKNILLVDGREISLKVYGDQDYFSLTDMVRQEPRPDIIIANWMRNKDTLEFLGLWEKLNNPAFNPIEFDGFLEQSGRNRFALSPSDWIDKTQATGLQVKRGRNGGTYAHKDIAFDFGAWISPSFRYLLIIEFQRLKDKENNQQQRQWSYRRFLSKVNYRLHTDSIKEHLIPKLEATQGGEWLIYADEADLLNMAVFGMTAKQWRETNPEQAQGGNMRDFADLIQLNVLANLESLNSVMIDAGTDKAKRFDLLRKTAISQYQRLSLHPGLKRLEGE